MASVLAIVSKAVFAQDAGRLDVGDVYPTELYRSANRGLSPLAEGGDLFLATVRPGDVLWLVAVLDAPRQTAEGWSAAGNTVPITDVSRVISKLRFSTGKGISVDPGKLGMSLQTPRVLTDADVRLLRGLASPAGTSATRPRAKATPRPEASPTPARPKAKATPQRKASPATARPKAKPARATAPTRSGNADAMMRSLLAAWQRTRSAELATVIAAHSRASESVAARALRERSKIPQGEWLKLAAGLGVIDRGALLASLAGATSGQVTERVEALDAWDPDPRVSDALHDMIRQLPWVSTGSRKVWTRTFKLLATLGDPRTVEVAEAFDPAGIASSWEGPGLWMGERLTKLAATIRGLAEPEALTPEHRAMIEAISALLPRDASSNSELSAAAQLEHVLRHPDDDDARLVLADALQEAGDPRGELITLQYLAESSTLNSEQRKRVKQILSKHVDDLLGPLAPIVMKRGQVFRRGFLHACELKENIHATQLEAVRDSDLLATIHTVRAPIDFILLPGLRSLRDAAVIGSSQPIERLLLHETPLPFESVELTVYEDEVELLDRCTCLPELKKLSVDGPEDAIVAAAATRLARGVEWLHLCGFATGRFGDSVRQILSARGTRVSMVSTHGSDSAPGDYRFDLQVKRARPPEVAIELSLPSAGWDGSMTRCLRDLGTSLGSLRPLGARSVAVRLLKKIDEGTRKRLLHVLRSNVADPDSLVISP